MARAAFKLLQILLWSIKGALLAIALAALVAWPVTLKKWIGVIGEKFVPLGESGEQHWTSAECQHGWILVCRSSIQKHDPLYSAWLDECVQTRGKGWDWKSWSTDPPTWGEVEWTNRLGPFRAKIATESIAGGNRTERIFGAPNWAVVLAAGTWPVWSLARAIRRRRNRRRCAREGLCPHCGYDLRATPTPASKGGALLAHCPECGKDANFPAPSHAG